MNTPFTPHARKCHILGSSNNSICDEQKADALNQFFHSCFNTATPPLTSEEGSSYGLDPAACPQELYCSEQEVFELLVNLDSKKASGPDGISARMIKETAC